MIQINGVYEYDTGRTDFVHRCKEVYRIYLYKKVRRYYKCLINKVGTDVLIHDAVSAKFLRDNCKYIGPARTTWEDLFQVKVGENGVQ